MKTLSESLNMKTGEVAGAYVMKGANLGINAYDMLCLICAELNINVEKYSDADFGSAASILEDFCRNLNEDSGYTVSVWVD